MFTARASAILFTSRPPYCLCHTLLLRGCLQQARHNITVLSNGSFIYTIILEFKTELLSYFLGFPLVALIRILLTVRINYTTDSDMSLSTSRQRHTSTDKDSVTAFQSEFGQYTYFRPSLTSLTAELHPTFNRNSFSHICVISVLLYQNHGGGTYAIKVTDFKTE
jgi:hypothetical protein